MTMTNSETRTDIAAAGVIDAIKAGIDDARSRGIVVSRVTTNVYDWSQYAGVYVVDNVPVWTSPDVPRGQATVDGPGNHAALSLRLYTPVAQEQALAAARAIHAHFRGTEYFTEDEGGHTFWPASEVVRVMAEIIAETSARSITEALAELPKETT